MPSPSRQCGLDRVVQSLVGDGTVLCAVIVAGGKASIVVNSNYPGALEHAEHHIATQTDEHIWICSPDCPGAI